MADRLTPAATVVPLRDGRDGLEVLLVQRGSRGAFGGLWVFPGGKVDPSELGPDELASARAAAVREAAEESGLVLEEGGLVTLSHWVPPAEAPRRFATWFFLAAADDQAVVLDHTEVHRHEWLAPAAATAARNAGRIELAPPTFTTLWWLSEFATVEAALSAAAGREPERFATHIALGPDGALLATVWSGDVAYEGGDLSGPGPRRRLWMPAGEDWRVEMSG